MSAEDGRPVAVEGAGGEAIAEGVDRRRGEAGATPELVRTAVQSQHLEGAGGEVQARRGRDSLPQVAMERLGLSKARI